MSSTSEHLPKPEPSDSHQHVWQFCVTPAVRCAGVKVTVYRCKCGTYLQRGARAD